MNSMVTVRLATMDDAALIARQTADLQRLHYEALPHLFRAPHDDLFPPERLYALLKDANAIIAVADWEGDAVGHLYAQVTPGGSSSRHREIALYIHQIGVREDMRGKGAGTALIGFIEERAQALGAHSIGLDHWAFNTPARGFFEARGYQPSNIRMRKEVAPQRPPAPSRPTF